MKPMIVGQAPAKGNEGLLPFAGRSGSRLAKLAGVGDSGDDLPDHFDLRNLLPYYPGKDGAKGDNFPMQEAVGYAMALKKDLLSGPERTVLLMGHRVKIAFGLKKLEYLESTTINFTTFIPFPHPSGINMWYNSPAHCDQARIVLRRVLANGR